MSKVKLLISVDDDCLQRISEVIQNLKSAGFQVEQSMPQLGVISGWCEQANVEAISHVEGVANVETEQKYQIAPPESEIQ